MSRLRIVKFTLTAVVLAAFTACASVPMASPERDAESKRFEPPPAGMAGIYIYRDSFVGQALKKDLYIDGKRIGETANKVYYHRDVTPGPHKLSTESEFSPNALEFVAEAGRNHFFRQYIKMGVFVGGANLEAVSDDDGRNAVLGCKEALGVDVAPPQQPPRP